MKLPKTSQHNIHQTAEIFQSLYLECDLCVAICKYRIDQGLQTSDDTPDSKQNFSEKNSDLHKFQSTGQRRRINICLSVTLKLATLVSRSMGGTNKQYIIKYNTMHKNRLKYLSF